MPQLSLVHGIRERPWHVALDRDPAAHPRERMREIDLAIRPPVRGDVVNRAHGTRVAAPSFTISEATGPIPLRRKGATRGCRNASGPEIER
jgi:hypothetical protein